jgi:hypothetical protein
MRAVTRAGGTVGSVVWDYVEGMTMLRAFWDAAIALDPEAPDEGRTMRYCTPEQLDRLWRRCGMRDVETRALLVDAFYRSFDDCWVPFTAGIGPAGAYCLSLGRKEQQVLRDEYFRRLGSPEGSFRLSARAWFVRGTA